MSGRKQHFIPQSLLRGFGIERGNKTYVVAYTFERGTFSPATDGIGAERNFYSELDVDGNEETLDDIITDYEGPFPTILAELRSLNDRACADPAMAAEFVTHLVVRNDHFRKSITCGGAKLVEGLATTFSEEAAVFSLLGLDRSEPSEIISAEAVKLWCEYGPFFETLGLNEAQFIQIVHTMMKENFSSMHREVVGPIARTLGDTLARLGEITADSQRRSLSQNVAPKQRVDWLRGFEWKIHHIPYSIALPDCVSVIVGASGETLPHMLADTEEPGLVLMPLSSDRLLVGSTTSSPDFPESLNEEFARCSWDFFVAKDRNDYFEGLRPLLRTRVSDFLDETIDEVLGEAIGGRASGAPPAR